MSYLLKSCVRICTLASRRRSSPGFGPSLGATLLLFSRRLFRNRTAKQILIGSSRLKGSRRVYTAQLFWWLGLGLCATLTVGIAVFSSLTKHADLPISDFWGIIFGKTDRPILRDVFRGLEDRAIRYVPLILKLYPDPAKRPRQREVLIELYRTGKVDEAVRAFKKVYLEVVQRIIDHLETAESANSPD
jgi:hypothetical protein